MVKCYPIINYLFNNSMRISLIITTYNRPDALLLVLKSIEVQSLSPLEVIIADDGSDEKTMELIKKGH